MYEAIIREISIKLSCRSNIIVFSIMPIKQQIPVIFRSLCELLSETEESTCPISIIFKVFSIVFVIIYIIPCTFIYTYTPCENLTAHVRLLQRQPVFLTVTELKADAEPVAGSPNI